ncbi:S-adenosyl-methyltransferase MraW [Thiovulum sp. ES]|nr:S-adenosyl-methyltransferase MraW [Thiovulum sp. ES]
MENIPHKPVLLREVLEAFSTEKSGVFIDATLGYGGHSSAILENSPNLHLIGIDKDITAVEFSKKRLKKFGNRVKILHGTFSEKIEEAKTLFPDLLILGVLADIGVSSLQLDNTDRGFSFNSPNLDMRMDQNSNLTGNEVVNRYSEFRLHEIFRDFGELKNSKKLARVIVNNRPIESGLELASLIEQNSGRKSGGIHPATLVFQAIRIEVNRELEELETLLNSLKTLENSQVGIISFHSLEDRIVKDTFRDWSKSCICPPEAIQCTCGDNHQLGKPLSKKPIVAKNDEVSENPRSRSAKLRIFNLL